MKVGDVVSWKIMHPVGKFIVCDKEEGPILSISGPSACVRRPNGRKGFIATNKLTLVKASESSTETGGVSHGNKE